MPRDEELVDVLASDTAITALAERRPTASDDPVLRALASWAADIDARPVAATIEAPAPEETRRRSRGAVRSVVAMTVALTLSSTGIAAAVKGDPFGPLTFVVTKFGNFGHHDRPPSVSLLGDRAPLGPPSTKPDRSRDEAANRPSRDHERAADAGASQDKAAQAPLVSHEQTGTAGGVVDDSQPPQRHDPLVVRPAHPAGDGDDGPVVTHKPGSGLPPPDRPEPTPRPSQTPVPKPFPGQLPPPPDQPLPSPID